MPETMKLTGIQKIAVVLISLGSDLSSKILKQHFSDEEIERISLEISNMTSISPELQAQVFEEFVELCQAHDYILQGGVKYARELLDKTVGPSKSAEIVRKLVASSKKVPFSSLRKTDPRHLVNFLQNEHPQTIAMVLAFLEPQQASMIISALPEELQIDIARRIALMERTSPEVIREVERVLESKLSSIVQHDYTNVGGIKSLVDILNRVDRGTEKAILEDLEKHDPALVEEIRKRLFVFEDIITLDDVSIQRVLREVDSKDLALALKGSNEDVKERIFKNLSKRAGEMLKDEIDYMGPVRLKDVENAQQKIVNVVRTLDETGEIIIARGGQDAIVI